MEQTEPTDLSSFPSIDLAYPIALSSYDSLMKRFDAQDARIQTLMAWGTALALAVVAAFKGPQTPSLGKWFWSGMVLFVIALVLGTTARLYGKLIFLDPAILFKSYLAYPEQEFKKDVIYWAGKHFDKNCRVIDIKHQMASASMFFFFLAVPVLAIWASARF